VGGRFSYGVASRVSCDSNTSVAVDLCAIVQCGGWLRAGGCGAVLCCCFCAYLGQGELVYGDASCMRCTGAFNCVVARCAPSCRQRENAGKQHVIIMPW
jgi:hypothetical protein